MAYDAMGKSQIAVAYVKKAIKISPTISDYWFILGDIQIKLSKVEEGIEAYRKVIELEPEDPEIWLELSVAYSLLENFGEAAETLQEGMKWHEGNPDFYYGLANFLFKAGKTQQSYEILEKALSMDHEGYRRMYSLYPDLRNNTAFAEIIESHKTKS